MNVATWIALFITAFSSCMVNAQAKDSAPALSDRASKPGWTIETNVSPKEPRLSDSISLEFVVESDPGFSLQEPELLAAPDEYTVRQPLEQVEISSGNRRVFRAVVAPNQSGETSLPRLAITYSRSPGLGDQNQSSSQGIMASPLVKIKILPGPDGSNLAAIVTSGIETLPEEANVWQTWGLPILGVIGVLLLGLVGNAVRLWFLNRPSQPESPEGMANRLLDGLIAENLPEQGQFQEFYIRLTGIVRELIAKKTGLSAPELTTEEFWLEAQRSPRFSTEWSQTLRDFLVSADLVKFGGQKPDRVALDQAVSTAREAIQRIASNPAESEGVE